MKYGLYQNLKYTFCQLKLTNNMNIVELHNEEYVIDKNSWSKINVKYFLLDLLFFYKPLFKMFAFISFTLHFKQFPKTIKIPTDRYFVIINDSNSFALYPKKIKHFHMFGG